MSDNDGIDEAVEGGLRQTFMLAAQVAERVARARQEALRQHEHDTERAAVEYQRHMAAEQAAMRAVLTPTGQDRWWDQAKPEQVVEAYQAAEAWKDYDPQALAASERINEEVQRRYGINAQDLNGDGLYLQSGIETQHAARAHAEAVREHGNAMALIVAAQTEETRRNAAALRPEMERYNVPEEYLANRELVDALTASRDAAGPEAKAAADLAVAEQVHLIKKDGVNGPSIEQLREEIRQIYSGAEESLFADAGFVSTAKVWHDAKTLAEAGFVTQGDAGLQTRYENSEEELFERIASMGHDIEEEVLNDPASQERGAASQALDTASISYGSAQHREEFAASLAGTAEQEHIDARILAAGDQAKHPREATRAATKAPKARKTRSTSGVNRDKARAG